MLPFLIGAVVLALLLWGSGTFARLKTQDMAKGLRLGGGWLCLAGAAFVATRGQIGLAVPLGAAGLGLLGWLPWTGAGIGGPKGTGQTSRVRSGFFDMELDHDTGKLRGTMVAGRYQGQPLDQLELSQLLALFPEIDEESRSLLAAYLDRRDARWREHADAGAAPGQAGATSSGKMTEEEAYQILGLQPGASELDIGGAHRSLMKKLHPDQGGSTYLAARVNEAKDVLLRRHR